MSFKSCADMLICHSVKYCNKENTVSIVNACIIITTHYCICYIVAMKDGAVRNMVRIKNLIILLCYLHKNQ
jgi:hypothetical protein